MVEVNFNLMIPKPDRANCLDTPIQEAAGELQRRFEASVSKGERAAAAQHAADAIMLGLLLDSPLPKLAQSLTPYSEYLSQEEHAHFEIAQIAKRYIAALQQEHPQDTFTTAGLKAPCANDPKDATDRQKGTSVVLDLEDTFATSDQEDGSQDPAAYASLALRWSHAWLHLLYGEGYEEASKALLQAREHHQHGIYISHTLTFYEGLAHAGICQEATGAARRRPHNTLAQCCKILRWHCIHYHPTNFRSKAAFLDAERLRLEGHIPDADAFYKRAIEFVRAEGLSHEAALVCEYAGRFYLEQGHQDTAHELLHDAYSRYETWGARSKLHTLRTQYPQLF